MPFGKRQSILLFILLVALAIIYISGLFVDVTRDAAKYAYISKEIVANQQWINLQIDGEPYEQKPHLMFWLSAISYLIFGVSNFAFKFPILLYSLAGLYFTYRLGKSMFNSETGIISATITAFSIIFILYNQDLHTDTLLFTNTALALWQLYEYLKTNKIKHLLLSGLGLGLCLLTKGPFGVVLPFLMVAGYLVFQGKWRSLINPRWLLVVLVAFAVALPVFYQLWSNWGLKGVSFFFFGNTMGRFTGSYLGHTPDPSFYFHNIIYLFLPWPLLFFTALFLFFKKLKQKQLSDPDHFLYWGFLAFFILLSVSMSKLPNYLMGALPVMMIISARTWIEYFRESGKMLKAQQVAVLLVWIVAVAVIFYFSKEMFIWEIGTLVLLFILTNRFTKPLVQHEKVMYRSLIAFVVAGLLFNLTVLPVLFGHQAQPKAAAYLNEFNTDQTNIYNYQKSSLKHLRHLWEPTDSIPESQLKQTPAQKHFSYNYELKFYSNYPAYQIEKPDELNLALSKPGSWFFTDDEGMEELKLRANFDTIITYEHFSLKRTAKYFFPDDGKSPFINRHLIKIE